MKQVYLTKHRTLDKQDVFSSRQKAITYFTGCLDNPDFEGAKEFTTVSVNGSVVGWITKKPVQ